MLCWKCGKSVETKEKIQRKDVCPECESDLRCCYNCEFYDKAAHHQCKEPQSEWVRYKERGNFCDYFRPKSTFFKKGPAVGSKEAKKQKWESLFRDDSQES
jgi:hypothetical protein